MVDPVAAAPVPADPKSPRARLSNLAGVQMPKVKQQQTDSAQRATHHWMSYDLCG